MSKHQELLDYIDDLEIGKRSVFVVLRRDLMFLTVQPIVRLRKLRRVVLFQLMTAQAQHGLRPRNSA